MIYVKDKNIDTPVSPSSPENVGAGQVIVPGESGLVTGVALQSGALTLHVILIEDLEGILVVNKSGINISATSQLCLRAVFLRLLMGG